MSKCEQCASKSNCQKNQETCDCENNTNHAIKKVIAVMSGKGGVGKSSVTTLLAKSLISRGLKVGILDADISGPTIPRFTQTANQHADGDAGGIYPIVSSDGIKIMSFNAISETEEQPAIWRAPLINKALKQFYSDVYWGELDCLLIDMPPGTSDVALSVFQLMPISGVFMITTPQPMVSMIVAKALNLCQQADIKVLGLIENMSYLQCPSCSHKIIFNDNDESQKLAVRHQTKVLAKLPYKVDFATLEQDSNIDKNLIALLDNCVEEIKKLSES